MKSDQDFHVPGISQGTRLPTPLNKDHNYFLVPVDCSYSTAAWHCNTDYSADVTSNSNDTAYSEVITDWKAPGNARTQGQTFSDVTEDRNSRSDVISASKPSIVSEINIMTCSDVTECGNPPYDVRKNEKLKPDVIGSRNSSCDVRKIGNSPHHKVGRSFSEMVASQDVRDVCTSPGDGLLANAGETVDIFSDSKDPTSPYGMLIDEGVIESLLSQAKAVKEPNRSDSRMKLDSRYRTNSSDSAFSEDSLLEDDQDSKLETLISQFIFNPTNDLTEYVESNHNATVDTHVDVDGLDVTDLFRSAAMFDPDLGGPTSPGFAAAELESGLGSSENSICSDNHDSSPVKRHKPSLLQKNDSISSLSSTSSSSSASSSSSSSFSASLSLSSLSLEALSSSAALHLQASVITGDKNEVWEHTGACGGDSSVTDSRQARDCETSTPSPTNEGTRSPLNFVSSKGDNSDNQGEDSTGFFTLPTAHLAPTKTSSTINTFSQNNSKNNDNDNRDNYGFLFSHLKNGFQPPFEIRGDNSDLLLDEPDFVDFPFPTDSQNCRPNLPEMPTSQKRGMELNGLDNPVGSIAGFHSYESITKQNKPSSLLDGSGSEGGEKVLDESFTNSVLYLTKPPPADPQELTPNNLDYFNEFFEAGPKRNEVEECYSDAITSQSPFLDWFSIDDSQIENSMNDATLTSSLNFNEIYEPREAKHRKSDEQEIVELCADFTSTPKSPKTDTSKNIADVQSHAPNSCESTKSVRLLCSVKKCSSSKRPVQTVNFIKKVPNKKKSLSQCRTLPVSNKSALKFDCHESKKINCVNRVPMLGTPQLNRTKCNQLKNTHYAPQIEILSWDDTGSLHVKVPKLSVKNKESRNSHNRVPCSLLREALTAEEPHPSLFGSFKEGKHKNTKSKLYRNVTSGFSTETLTREIPSSSAQNSGSKMSELEKYLRGIIPTDPANEGRCKTSGSQYFEDSSEVSFLRKLLTGEMSTHAYREIDKKICEKKRREIK